MKKLQLFSLFVLIASLFTSCELVEGIFEVGMGVGIFIILAVIVIIVFIISRFRK